MMVKKMSDCSRRVIHEQTFPEDFVLFFNKKNFGVVLNSAFILAPIEYSVGEILDLLFYVCAEYFYETDMCLRSRNS